MSERVHAYTTLEYVQNVSSKNKYQPTDTLECTCTHISPPLIFSLSHTHSLIHPCIHTLLLLLPSLTFSPSHTHLFHPLILCHMLIFLLSHPLPPLSLYMHTSSNPLSLSLSLSLSLTLSPPYTHIYTYTLTHTHTSHTYRCTL